jgi:asparagine synthase (glutamine-hydrolysing)
MSGIVGILHLDGAPIDRRLLGRMTDFMAFRGPDAQEIWVDGNVGFGHTLLKTTDESERERQPFTLDGRVWIVADARVDARSELIAKLKAHGHDDLSPGATDVELLLRVYQVWDEDCVEHLLGDFAFALWDGPHKRFFCARDHLGVKPLFYAHLGQKLIFSNTLDCIRQHPAVSDRLNDLAIADFLMFELNQDKATTTFGDIQRVPPAHSATCSEGGLGLRRYWTLPIDEPVYFRRHDDYIDRFGELLSAAVGDRLRTDHVGIFMSGGLDSPTLAATANRLLRGRFDNPAVCAFTIAYDGYDEERHYAGLVASQLGIPIKFHGWNCDTFDPDWHRSPFHTPEPVSYPARLNSDFVHMRQIAAYSRVALFGEGPDNALRYEWRPFLSYLARQGRFGRLSYDVCRHALLHRRIPLLPTIPRILKRRLSGEKETIFFPDWFNRELEDRLQLHARWDRVRVEPASPHAVRPVGHSSFDIPLWQAIFETYDPAFTRSALEVRYPFIDLRLLRYLLAVPAMPWCRSKYMIRRAMRGLLPEAVLRRPKAPLVHDPWTEHLQRCALPPLAADGGLKQYVDVDRARASVGDQTCFWVDFRPRALSYWLQNVHPERHNTDSTVRHCHKEFV